jgi:hypothetical protein
MCFNRRTAVRRKNLIALENRLRLRALPGAAVLHCYDLSLMPILLQGGLQCGCGAEQGDAHRCCISDAAMHLDIQLDAECFKGLKSKQMTYTMKGKDAASTEKTSMCSPC